MARRSTPHIERSDQKLTPEDAFGRVVRERRLELGLTQADLEVEGIERSYISKLEAGKHQVGLRGILLLADKLKLTPEELIARVVHRLGARRR